MPKYVPQALSPAQETLAAQVHELLKDAKPGEVITLPVELVRAMDDAARDAALAKLNEKRLHWLHDSRACDVDGYEWGVFRVKWGADGKASEVWQTHGDFSDLDAAMEKTK